MKKYNVCIVGGYDDIFRLRIGDYRDIFRIIDNELLVYVFDIGSRKIGRASCRERV